jgi:hypothetical protein
LSGHVIAYALRFGGTTGNEPVADGQVRILKVYEKDRTVQLPRIAGQVAVAMSFNNEGGAILEFNNGLAWNFDYDLQIVGPNGARIDPRFPVCTVGGERFGTEHWPLPYKRLVISGFRRINGFTC